MSSLRFFTGDANGLLKSIALPLNSPTDDVAPRQLLLAGNPPLAKEREVQRLAWNSETKQLVVARANMSVEVLSVTDEDPELERGKGVTVETVLQYTEDRPSSSAKGDAFVGLDQLSNNILTCTSSGLLRFQPTLSASSISTPTLLSLSSRLSELRLSPNQASFAYGGNEVDLSLWDVERAGQGAPTEGASGAPGDEGLTGKEAKKLRKAKAQELLWGEVWRAKNLPNDSLSLRVPIHITSLAYLSASLAPAQATLVTGNANGSVRLYDTRAARRPVGVWDKIVREGSVRRVEKGAGEHEVFVCDDRSNLFTVDTRNGNVLGNHKGLAGSISSLASTSRTASAPSYLASASLDRFVRLHTAPSAPVKAGQNATTKGETLCKVFVKSQPTAIVWDGVVPKPVAAGTAKRGRDADAAEEGEDESEGELDEVFEGMGEVVGREMEVRRKDDGRRVRPKRR